MFNRRFGCSRTLVYTKVTYTTPGTFFYTIPPGVSRIRITVAGGGGGGGYNKTCEGYDEVVHYGGSGGIGGRIAPTVINGTGQITIVVGGRGGTGQNGGNSSVTVNGTTYTATGGSRGGDGWCFYHYTKGGGGYEHGNGSVGAPGTPTGTGGTSGNGYVYIEFGGDIL